MPLQAYPPNNAINANVRVLIRFWFFGRVGEIPAVLFYPALVAWAAVGSRFGSAVLFLSGAVELCQPKVFAVASVLFGRCRAA